MLIMKGKLLFLLPLILSCNQTTEKNQDLFSDGEWIDMTYPYAEESVYWPTAETFHLDTAFEGVTDKGYYYSAYNFSAAEHGGTHLDAPVHFAKGKWSNDQIPIEKLVGEASVIDVSDEALKDPDYLISIADIESWEKNNGRLEDNTLLFFRTGYGAFYPDKEKYLGTSRRGEEGVAALHFPALDPEAAEWLVKNRQVKAVGLDVASVDYGQSADFRTHRILYEQNIPGFENVANLDKLPVKGAMVFALPMKIKGGSGGPLRIVAWIKNVH